MISSQTHFSHQNHHAVSCSLYLHRGLVYSLARGKRVSLRATRPTMLTSVMSAMRNKDREPVVLSVVIAMIKGVVGAAVLHTAIITAQILTGPAPYCTQSLVVSY